MQKGQKGQPPEAAEDAVESLQGGKAHIHESRRFGLDAQDADDAIVIDGANAHPPIEASRQGLS
ncbi:hypothetical protein DSCA_47790 [Desulfosarcina alkanivorans]|uniref:Uncharacterized protein n=1 Tax=Desulfosarcina alkanivorans TaxID=571177 RepID=A0A5K7YSC1_9BACT|nr:hypothetical protein DSCA_47790 [Desulfosarcina alkanivorans]